MQLLARLAAVLAVLALVTPAVACEGMKDQKAAETKETAKPVVATAQKAPAPAKAPEAKQAAKPAPSQD